MRELVRCQVKAIYPPKDNPFKEGEKQQGIKIKVVDGPETYINLKAGHPWIDSLKVGRFTYVLKQWSAKKKDPDTGKEGAYGYYPIKISDGDFNVVPATNENADIDHQAAAFLLSLLVWLSTPIEIQGKPYAPMGLLLSYMKKNSIIDQEDHECIKKAFKFAIHLAKMIGPEKAPPLIDPSKNSAQDWNNELLCLESSLQEALENKPALIPDIIDNFKISQMPKHIRQKARRIMDNYLDKEAA